VLDLPRLAMQGPYDLHRRFTYSGSLENFNINTAGFVIVGVFVLTWAVALAVWHFGKIEQKMGPGRHVGNHPRLARDAPASGQGQCLLRSRTARCYGRRVPVAPEDRCPHSGEQSVCRRVADRRMGLSKDRSN